MEYRNHIIALTDENIKEINEKLPAETSEEIRICVLVACDWFLQKCPDAHSIDAFGDLGAFGNGKDPEKIWLSFRHQRGFDLNQRAELAWDQGGYFYATLKKIGLNPYSYDYQFDHGEAPSDGIYAIKRREEYAYLSEWLAFYMSSRRNILWLAGELNKDEKYEFPEPTAENLKKYYAKERKEEIMAFLREIESEQREQGE